VIRAFQLSYAFSFVSGCELFELLGPRRLPRHRPVLAALRQQGMVDQIPAGQTSGELTGDAAVPGQRPVHIMMGSSTGNRARLFEFRGW